MEDRNIRRGEIYHANLNPVFGSEQGDCRPVLVIQNNRGNRYSPTVIVAAITSRPKNKMPTHVWIKEGNVLLKDSIVLLEQIRTLDKRRLGKYMGKLGRKTMQKIDKAIFASVGVKRRNKNFEKVKCDKK